MIEIRFESYNDGIFSMRSYLSLSLKPVRGKGLYKNLIVHIK